MHVLISKLLITLKRSPMKKTYPSSRSRYPPDPCLWTDELGSAFPPPCHPVLLHGGFQEGTSFRNQRGFRGRSLADSRYCRCRCLKKFHSLCCCSSCSLGLWTCLGRRARPPIWTLQNLHVTHSPESYSRFSTDSYFQLVIN